MTPLYQRFWSEANRGHKQRIALLIEYAAIVVGPPEPDVRAETSRAVRRQRSNRCFACDWPKRMAGRLIWHHIIQVQNGGSSRLWNLVRLCEDCHAQIHPWLPRPACKGWSSTLDVSHIDLRQAKHARGTGRQA